jgi:hypothetical protein
MAAFSARGIWFKRRDYALVGLEANRRARNGGVLTMVAEAGAARRQRHGILGGPFLWHWLEAGRNVADLVLDGPERIRNFRDLSLRDRAYNVP